MSDHDDFAFEPVPGLPAALPQGEQLLWQGSPEWKSLAVHGYHIRKVALYFLVLVVWRIGNGISAGHGVSALALSCLWIVCLGATAIGVLSLLAYWSARMAVYSVTSERVLLRHGIAVPMTINIPFALVASAALRRYADGTGDLTLALSPGQRLGYIITWPYVRPGKITRPELDFRALKDPERAAEILGQALAAHAGVAAVRIGAPSTPAANPVGQRSAAAA
ncbi:MAG: photosynthetic complex putative assembly protein PuhB [Steroidobacteraceae bacterium]|jgi:hypothetical protein